jgi:hypothetical protein
MVVCALTASACGGAAEEGTGDDRAFPSSAVAAWLEAVDAGDVARINAVVDRTTVGLIVAIENGFDAGQTAVLVDDGLPANLAPGYWASFSNDFSEFSGRALSGLTVGAFEELPGGQYAVVDLGQEGTTDVIVLRADDGWRVDMVATLGAGIIAPLSRFFAGLPADEDGDQIRAVLRTDVVPSLQVIADRTVEPTLAADTERLIVEIESYVS